MVSDVPGVGNLYSNIIEQSVYCERKYFRTVCAYQIFGNNYIHHENNIYNAT